MNKRIDWYQNKHFLILSDNAELRMQLTALLKDFGVKRILTARTTAEAIAAYLRQQPHYVIADYELSAYATGLDFLRGLTDSQQYRFGSGFILCCSPQHRELLNQAHTDAIDQVWTPPLQKLEVRKQLDSLIAKKAALRQIQVALDTGEYQTAVTIAQEKVNRVPKLAFDCLQMMAIGLLRQGQTSAAQQVYERVLRNADLGWAQLGLANCQYELGQYLDVVESCQQVINQHHYCVAAYHLSARALIQLQQYQPAAEQLQRALDMLPNDVELLRRSAWVALRQRQLDSFARCYRRLITVANDNDSVALMAADYVNYARGLFHQYCLAGPLQGARFLTELQEVLKRQQRRWQEHPQLLLPLRLIQARMHSQQQRQAEADSLIDEVLSECLSLQPELLLREEIELTAQHCTDSEPAQQLHQQVNQGFTVIYPVEHDAERAQTLNRQGMELFQQQRLTAAKQRFVDAFRYDPTHPSIALNLLQTLLRLLEQHHDELPITEFQEDIDRARRCILTAQTLPQSDNRRHHLTVLTTRLNTLRYRQPAPNLDQATPSVSDS